MSAEKVNPLVEEPESAEELAALEEVGAQIVTSEPAHPIAPDETAPIERRSRRADKQAKTPEQELADLTKLEAFRVYQAQVDKNLEKERQRAAALERQMLEREAQILARQTQERQGRLQFLETQIESEDLEPEKRRQARYEREALVSQAYAEQLRQWEQYKQRTITERGLDPTDVRFNRVYSSGQVGLAEFQADLAAAEAARLKRELDEAKKAAVTPDKLAELVRAEVAKLAAKQGLDTVDLGEPGGAIQDDEWDHDFVLVNQGKMKKEKFIEKYRGRI